MANDQERDRVVEKMAWAICKRGKYETGHGTCALICMDQLGNPRERGCAHATEVHGAMACATLAVVEAERDRIVEKVARALAPASWAALGTGDTLAHANRRKASLRHACAALAVAGEELARDIEDKMGTNGSFACKRIRALTGGKPNG
ncbi:MAG: hypothetical protein KGL39_56675 [Patescibacteria group bacterium]|nr:hypothetical protein [Patescibacteria group bacterium]